MTPDQTLVIAVFFVGAAALVVCAWVLASERRIQPRRAARPPVDGVRVAAPGAVPPPPMAPTPYVEPEEHRTGRLVRPFFTHLAEVAATPATAPTTLPAVRQINGARVALVESVTCGICRDGRSVALDKCPWCGCPAGGWMA